MAEKDLIKELTKIKGVGEAKAKAIIDGGFDSIEKIKKAKKKDLTEIKGVTDSIANKIINNYQEKKKVEEKTPKNTQKKQKKEETKKQPKIKEEKSEKKEETDEKIKIKKKAKLSNEIKQILEKRKEIKKRTPKFRREEWYRYKRISKNWRRPDGIHSKMRANYKYRPSKVRVGFRGPKKTRGLHSSGFKEVMVYNKKDLDKINPDIQAARIGSSVGTKKRIDIEKRAEELDIRILNMQHQR